MNVTQSPDKIPSSLIDELNQISGLFFDTANDDASIIPHCNGGTTAAPSWLMRIPFWAALCVHAPSRKVVSVDIGTNLIAHKGLSDATAITERQVYYSLSQIDVPAGHKQLVYAVCGGGGDWLWNGARVVPGHRLPAPSVKRLAAHINTLIGISKEIEFLESMLPRADPAQSSVIKDKLKLLDEALTDAAGLLRDALIQENTVVLKKSGRPRGPLWH